jgi:hypothetical protein
LLDPSDATVIHWVIFCFGQKRIFNQRMLYVRSFSTDR